MIPAYTYYNSTECPNGTYGLNCLQPCGHCRDNEPCNYIDGTCPNGCQNGFLGSKCIGSEYFILHKLPHFGVLTSNFEMYVDKARYFYILNIIRKQVIFFSSVHY